MLLPQWLHPLPPTHCLTSNSTIHNNNNSQQEYRPQQQHPQQQHACAARERQNPKMHTMKD